MGQWIIPFGLAGADWGPLSLISNFGSFRSDRRFGFELAITPIGPVLGPLLDEIWVMLISR